MEKTAPPILFVLIEPEQEFFFGATEERGQYF